MTYAHYLARLPARASYLATQRGLEGVFQEALRAPNQRELFLVPGLVSKLLSLARELDGEDLNKRLALRILSLLTCEQLNRRELCLTPNLIQVLMDNAPSNVKALGALVNLTFNQANMRELYQYPGLIRMLCRIVTHSLAQSKDLALVGLACLSYDVRNKWDMVFGAREELDLIAMLLREASNADMDCRQSCLIVLHNLRHLYIPSSLEEEEVSTEVVVATVVDLDLAEKYWRVVLQVWAISSSRTRRNLSRRENTLRRLPNELVRLVFALLM